MVRLKVTLLHDYPLITKDFNSNMVRLKALEWPYTETNFFNFNSNMVRLKDLIPCLIQQLQPNFNSNMVRLKD